MKKLTKVINRFLHPPKWARLFVSSITFAALTYVFAAEQTDRVATYVVYGMAAYCLTVLVLPMPKRIRRTKAAVVRQIDSAAFGGKYRDDLAFRGSISLCQGTAVNFLYALFRMVVGIRHASVWFVSMAVYYLVLGILRLSLTASYRHRSRVDEWRCYRRTARLLFLLNVPMGGMIVLMVLTNSGYSYPGYVIYLSAIYTFYTMAMSLVNLVKYRRLGSPILSAAKVLNVIAALMAVLGLQTAMIAQFSTESDDFRRTMNAVTGGVIWLSVILTAVYMLHRSAERKEEAKPVEPIRE